MVRLNEIRGHRADGTPIIDTRNKWQKLYDDMRPKILEALRIRDEMEKMMQLPPDELPEKVPKKITFETNEHAIEVQGVTCRKPMPKKRVCFAPDGKSMWYEEVE